MKQDVIQRAKYVQFACARKATASKSIRSQNQRSLYGETLHEQFQFSLRNDEFREATMQTDHKLLKNPHDGFIQTFTSGEVDGGLAVECALIV